MKMVDIRNSIARFIAPKYFSEFESKVNQRTAEIISKMDPFEPAMRQFHGIFSQAFERMEENLDERSRLSLLLWANTTSRNENFKYAMDYVANAQANETLKHAPVTPERILYGRAQISAVALLKKEIKRMANVYDDIMKKTRPEGFDENLSVE